MGVTLSYPYSLSDGTTADATQVMANFNAIVTLLASSVAASGANNDITSLAALTSVIPLAGGRTQLYIAAAATTGSANAQVLGTMVPGGYSLTAGTMILFNPGYTNTAALQINPNGQGLTNVYKQSPSGVTACTGGEVVLGQWALVLYDGTQFELVNLPFALTQASLASFIPFGAEESISSASTTDLGSISPNTHFPYVTGTTTITALGSSASTNAPIYLVKFAASLTLTYNSSSLILPGGVNITTQANDYALFEYLGSGNWRLIQYFPAAQTGKFLFASGSLSGTSLDISVPADAQEIEIELINPVWTSSGNFQVQYKVGGTSQTSGYVTSYFELTGSSTVSGSDNLSNSGFIILGVSTNTAGNLSLKITGIQSGNQKAAIWDFTYLTSSPTFFLYKGTSFCSTSTGLVSDILISFSSGTGFTSGSYRAYKIK